MKFSEKWLRELVNPAIDTQALVDQVTMAGLEVDEVEAAAKDFSGVVVGEILTAEQHPNADKLQVCTVTSGSEVFQVVCGAPNARAGLKTAFATVGAVLPTPDGKAFKIKKAKLRQVESFGMLCAEDELGISEDHDGIMELPVDAPVGTCIREYLSLDDNIIDVDLTPNRGDCLSITGLAREVGVLNKVPVTFIPDSEVAATIEDTFSIELKDVADCSRYVGRVIRNINPQAETPLWMKQKLERSGVRSIDPVVDVTNYILLELGQPMHAFDLNKLEGGIVVRRAEQGEKLTLLDGQDVELNADTLTISDASGPVAMAGIMGGEPTSVTAETQDIFLESAFFNPISIAGRARSYGLHTDSSHRFERGVDWQLQTKAINRATALLLEIVGGEAGPVVEAVDNKELPTDRQVVLRHAKVNSMLAFEMPAAEIEEILTRLGLDVEKASTDGEWNVAVPSYRFDISIEVDLIEELARVYGYNNLPVRTPTASMPIKANDETIVSIHNVRRAFTAMGYQEAITYSFIEAGLQKQFDDQYDAIALANPISAEMAVMRTSIWPGLVKAVQYNQNRQQSRVRMFESGQRFLPTQGDEIIQENVVAGVITGARDPEGWNAGKDTVDFFDIKGDLESLLSLGGASDEFAFVADRHVALHPGQTARIERNGKAIGYVGALHPNLVKELGLNGEVFLFEINQAALCQGKLPRYTEISKFPESRRDLAIIVDESVGFDSVRQVAEKHAGEFVKEVTLFDVYQGQGIEKGRKSLAVGLTWQHPSRTLNDEEINNAIDVVVSALAKEFSASLRE
ncbi:MULTISPECIES: phenylalanine--tRNA ligase subunit beta [unclassified Neptuniibacter]|uniref:phenylalanine--tRNA ligase subunit beta n=1 Tax=unclassified Neptuniibacter TaxID=2630693 RepID=UPI000C360F24|nr:MULTISPECIES: phenylalanine--tRNA ligase subunit beta [unclassified Neptuniibacter]MAY40992.1 phenylalanine--tRNA ligase subunit beta [Oceanospirillaceae bacterium]